MGGLFGGGGGSGSTTDVVNGLQLGTSSYGRPVPIVYGRGRVGGNVIWMPHALWDKVETEQEGGKGGGGGTTTTEYFQGLMIGICEGPVEILRVWRDKECFRDVSQVDTHHPLHFFYGTREQEPWDYLKVPFDTRSATYLSVPTVAPYTITLDDPFFTSFTAVIPWLTADGKPALARVLRGMSPGGTPDRDHYVASGATLTFASNYAGFTISIGYATHVDFTGQAIGYGGSAYVASDRLSLGNSNTLKNITYEVRGFYSSPNDSGDVNVATVVADLLTSTTYGAGWASSRIEVTNGQDGTAASGLAAACAAYDYRISPVMTEQRPASEWINEWLMAANAGCTWGDGKLKCVPLSDDAGSGFTPYTTPIYSLNRDDFVVKAATDDAITVARRAQEDTFNQIAVEFRDRETDIDPSTDRDDYNISEQDAVDEADARATGLRKSDSPTQLHCITRRTHARQIADILTRRSVHQRSTFTFTLPPRFLLLEPLDLLVISDDVSGISNVLVRILSIEENDDLDLRVEAVEWNSGISKPALFDAQEGEGAGQGQTPGAEPFLPLPPVVVSPPVSASEGVPELWIGTAGMTKDYGGCRIWLSWDLGGTYSMVGEALPAPWGMLAAALPDGPHWDALNEIQIDLSLSGGVLTSRTENGYESGDYPIVVEEEIIQYRTAALMSSGTYRLTTLRRGLLGSATTSHPAAAYCCAAAGMLKVPLDRQRLGQTVYVKLQAFNLDRRKVADLSTSPYVAYVIPEAVREHPGVEFSFDTFDPADWEFHRSDKLALVPGAGVAGGKTLRSTGHSWLAHRDLIPYEPTRLYRAAVRVRQVSEPTTGGKTFAVGFEGIAADGVTLVNRFGANTYTEQHFRSSGDLTSSWTLLVGYWSDVALEGTNAGVSQLTPGVAHQNVRYIRPVLITNWNSDPASQRSAWAVATGTVSVSTSAVERSAWAMATGTIVDPAASYSTLTLRAFDAGGLSAPVTLHLSVGGGTLYSLSATATGTIVDPAGIRSLTTTATGTIDSGTLTRLVSTTGTGYVDVTTTLTLRAFDSAGLSAPAALHILPGQGSRFAQVTEAAAASDAQAGTAVHAPLLLTGEVAETASAIDWQGGATVGGAVAVSGEIVEAARAADTVAGLTPGSTVAPSIVPGYPVANIINSTNPTLTLAAATGPVMLVAILQTDTGTATLPTISDNGIGKWRGWTSVTGFEDAIGYADRIWFCITSGDVLATHTVTATSPQAWHTFAVYAVTGYGTVGASAYASSAGNTGPMDVALSSAATSLILWGAANRWNAPGAPTLCTGCTQDFYSTQLDGWGFGHAVGGSTPVGYTDQNPHCSAIAVEITSRLNVSVTEGATASDASNRSS